MKNPSQPSVLFVCLGNICRSPMAEGALRELAQKHELALTVDSAGTGDWHIGSPPDARAIAQAAANGVDLSGLTGRQVAKGDFHQFDIIVAMDDDNFRDLKTMRPSDSRAKLLLAFDCVAGRSGESVTDPYFGAASGFQQTWEDVTEIAHALVKRLMK